LDLTLNLTLGLGRNRFSKTETSFG